MPVITDENDGENLLLAVSYFRSCICIKYAVNNIRKRERVDFTYSIYMNCMFPASYTVLRKKPLSTWFLPDILRQSSLTA